MKKNIGIVDMTVRIITGIILFYLGFVDNAIMSPGLSKTLVGLFGIVPFITGLARICPLYYLSGIDTLNKK